MRARLTPAEVRVLLDHARARLPHDVCLTYECFLGYVVQLGIDAGVDLQAVLEVMGIESERTHSCQGCDPCPPADLFADYVRRRADGS